MYRGGWQRCSRSPSEPDGSGAHREMQLGVLAIVLREHPSPVTLFDLERELLRDEPSVAATFALAHAYLDLGVAGLLYTHSDCRNVSATRAARHFAWLVS